MKPYTDENASVFDSPVKKGLRGAINLLGLNDPNSSLLGMAAPLEAPAAKLERLMLENKALKALVEGNPSLIPTETGRAYAEPLVKGRRAPAVTGVEKAPTLELSRTPAELTIPEVQKLPLSSGLSFESKFSLPEVARAKIPWGKSGLLSKK